MAADALETLIDEKDFRVQVVPISAGRFLVRASDCRPLVASEAWARYESGRASPTVGKLSELVRVVDPDADFVLRKVTSPALRKTG